jgi:hypothetical protein
MDGEAYTEHGVGRREARTLLKRFSPERKIGPGDGRREFVDDDVFNGAEVNTLMCANGECIGGHRGPRAWHASREAVGTCEAMLPPPRMDGDGEAGANRRKASATGRMESDGLVVLCDGSADHMGTGTAEWWNRPGTDGSNA